MKSRQVHMILSVLLAAGAAGVLAGNAVSVGPSMSICSEKDKDVSEPVLVSKVNPAYPADAKSEKISGPVELKVTIGPDGSVVEAEAVKSPDSRLSEAAIKAVKQWKYKPAINKEGKAVQVIATVKVNFKLK